MLISLFYQILKALSEVVDYVTAFVKQTQNLVLKFYALYKLFG